MLELLIRHGARVPKVSKWGRFYYFKHTDTAAFLLDHGMDPNHMNWHYTTLLHHVSSDGDIPTGPPAARSRRGHRRDRRGVSIDAVRHGRSLGTARRWSRFCSSVVPTPARPAPRGRRRSHGRERRDTSRSRPPSSGRALASGSRATIRTPHVTHPIEWRKPRTTPTPTVRCSIDWRAPATRARSSRSIAVTPRDCTTRLFA